MHKLFHLKNAFENQIKGNCNTVFVYPIKILFWLRNNSLQCWKISTGDKPTMSMAIEIVWGWFPVSLWHRAQINHLKFPKVCPSCQLDNTLEKHVQEHLVVLTSSSFDLSSHTYKRTITTGQFVPDPISLLSPYTGLILIFRQQTWGLILERKKTWIELTSKIFIRLLSLGPVNRNYVHKRYMRLQTCDWFRSIVTQDTKSMRQCLYEGINPHYQVPRKVIGPQAAYLQAYSYLLAVSQVKQNNLIKQTD